MEVNYDDVARAHERIRGAVHAHAGAHLGHGRRPTGAKVHFKSENLQRMGAFKFRGAYNALSQLSRAGEAARRGRVLLGQPCAGGGARGQAARRPGHHRHADGCAEGEAGRDARLWSRRCSLYESNEDRKKIAKRLAAERGLTLIPPFDHPHIVAGQGTAAKELIEDAGALDILLVPCGGGGLLSGCAIAAKQLSPACRVIGVEPAAGDDAMRSFRTKTLQTVQAPDTIADGARTTSLGKITFPLMLQLRRRHAHGDRRGAADVRCSTCGNA